MTVYGTPPYGGRGRALHSAAGRPRRRLSFLPLPRLRPLVVLCLLACLAPAAAHASLKMAIGAAEDEGRTGDPALARAKMDLAKAAGFNAVRVTAVWAPGLASLSTAQVESLQSAAAAAAFDGITVTVTVMPYGSRTT